MKNYQETAKKIVKIEDKIFLSLHGLSGVFIRSL